MPAGYEKPKYEPNVIKHKSNQQKHQEQVTKATPRTDKTASDQTKVKQKEGS